MRARPAIAVCACAWLAVRLAACGSFGAATGDRERSDGGSAGDVSDIDAGAHECTGDVLLEEDFQGDAAVPDGWSSTGERPLVLDQVEGRPAPSLLVALPAQSTGDETAAIMERTVTSPHARICIEMDVRVDADPTTYGGNAFTEFLILNPLGRENVYIEVQDIGMMLATDEGETPIPDFVFGAWNRIVVRVDYTTGIASARAGGVDVNIAAGPTGAPGSIKLTLGGATGGPAAAASVRTDNFRMTGEP